MLTSGVSAEKGGEGFVSADGQAVLVTARLSNDTVLNKYMLTVYDRTTKARLGEFQSPFSVVPFFVSDSRIIYQTGRYSYRADAEIVNEPPQIHAIDLKTGKEVWKLVVRDTAYHGPVPP
jgi:hypothetical protein